jgi:hypothetical protein
LRKNARLTLAPCPCRRAALRLPRGDGIRQQQTQEAEAALRTLLLIDGEYLLTYMSPATV